MAESEKPVPHPRSSLGTLADVIFTAVRSVIVVVLAAGLAATVFSWWTPTDFLPESAREGLSIAQATSQANITPTALPIDNWERRVGIVSGHRGNDSGAVCEDGSGVTEAGVNFDVAQRVVMVLRGRQYEVDLLEEFDARLTGYRAAALLSIHADSCEYINDIATGFKVTSASSRENNAEDQRLVQCLTDRYAQTTGLGLHPSVTADMTEYHTFGEISPFTPAAIIEIGFLYLDREVLTQQPDRVAQGIIDGLLCYLETPPPTPTPLPFFTPAAETPAAP